MSEVVLTEIIEDMDTDHDGEVDIEEYIRDILDDEDYEEGLKEREEINFRENLDKNKDGVMDREEVLSRQVANVIKITTYSQLMIFI